MRDGVLNYEPLAGEDINFTVAEALKLSNAQSKTVVINTNLGEIIIKPASNLETIISEINRRQQEVMSNAKKPEKQSFPPENLLTHRDFAETIVNLDFINESRLLDWIEQLYVLQCNTFIEDKSYIEIIIKTLEHNGYEPGYKSVIDFGLNYNINPKEGLKFIIGQLMKNLKDDGIISLPFINQLQKYRKQAGI